MKKLAFIILFLAAVICTSLSIAFADSGYTYGEVIASGEYQTISWSISQEGILTISGEGPLPDNIQPWYARRNDIDTVIIKAGITRIGASSFEFCSMSSIQIPDTVVSIGNNAFYSCGQLTSINIPKGVQEIDGTPFPWCGNLSEISVDPNNVYFSSESGILYDKAKTTLLAYPANKDENSFFIPASVICIGHGAFFQCDKLCSVEMPDSVETIEDFAFAFCSRLKSIDFPSGLSIIASCAFEETAIEEIKLPNSVKRIESCAFYLCNNLIKIFIPVSVEFISDNNSIPATAKVLCEQGSYADTWAKQYGYTIEYTSGNTPIEDPSIIANGEYENIRWMLSDTGLLTVRGNGSLPDYTQLWYGCRDKIFTVIIEEGITRIGSESFEFCPITNITIPDTVESIGYNAFYSCGQLTSITIPRGVKTIDGTVFAWCGKLSRIEVAEENESFCSVDGVLFDKDMTTLFSYPANKDGVQYTIPEGITCIGYGAFFRCTKLKEVIVPKTVNAITDFAFAFCSNLKTVNIPNGIKSINSCAFESTAIEDVVLPQSVERIESCAFYLCSIRSITIMEKVEYISDNNSIPNGTTIKCVKNSFADTWAQTYGYNIEYIPHIISHTEVIDEAVAATCTTTGLTEGKHCSVCNEVILAQETIPAKGHTEGAPVVVVEPTETSDGTQVIQCVNCKEILRSERIPATGTTHRPGDVSSDGKVDIMDTLLILQYFAGWNVTLDVEYADVNKDGVIGLSDALQILTDCMGKDLAIAMRALQSMMADLCLSSIEISEDPIDQYATAGELATFTVTASGDSLNYQWYINRNDGAGWKLIPGATSSAYTIENVSSADDGRRYYCAVTSDGGMQAISNEAVLHVTPAVELPMTGDASDPLLWFSLMAASLTGMLLLTGCFRKRFTLNAH